MRAPIHNEPCTIDRFAAETKVSLGYPAIEAFPNGRLVAAATLSGPGVKDLPGKKGRDTVTGHHVQTRVYTSSDGGRTWAAAESLPIGQSILYRAGSVLYAVGQCGTLQLARSPDGGATWSRPVALPMPDGAEAIADGPRNVCESGDYAYFACMIERGRPRRGYPGSHHTPVLYRARQGADLSARSSWSIMAEGPTFADFVPTASLAHVGVPFFNVPDADRSAAIGKNRWADPIGWHDAHVAVIGDDRHTWRTEPGEGLVMLCAARTHRGNIAAVAALRPTAGDQLSFDHVRAPSGQAMSLLPVPGGHLRFGLLHDAESAAYWLVGNAATDSMRQVRHLPHERHGLPCDERQCLQLHVSTNLVDWCTAGVLAKGADEHHTFHMPAVAAHGRDLHVVAATELAEAHDTRTTHALVFVTVPDFRTLETPLTGLTA